MKLGCRRNYHKGWAAVRHYANHDYHNYRLAFVTSSSNIPLVPGELRLVAEADLVDEVADEADEGEHLADHDQEYRPAERYGVVKNSTKCGA